MFSPMPAVALGVLLFIGVVLVGVAGEPVSRARVERFARRAMVTVTADNGNHIVRYLATTRRWRVVGLGGGITASFLLHLPNEVRFDAGVIFAGWFLGALVAEMRVAHLRPGARPAAVVRARRPSAYVGRGTWAAVPVAAVIALATAAATAAGAVTGRARPDWTATAWLLVALGIATAVRLIQRAVLHRAQPLAPSDVIEADDAIRSRSLHVLAAGGTALVLLCVSAQVAASHPVGASLPDLQFARGAFAVLVGLWCWAWATGSTRPASTPASAGAGGPPDGPR